MLVIFTVMMLCACLVSRLKGFFYRVEHTNMNELSVSLKRYPVSSRFRQKLNIAMSRLAGFSRNHIFSQSPYGMSILPARYVVEDRKFAKVLLRSVIVGDSGIFLGIVAAKRYIALGDNNSGEPILPFWLHPLEMVAFAFSVAVILSAAGKSQVFASVVQTATITMISLFSKKQFATEYSTENNPMQIYRGLFSANLAVACGVNFSGAFIGSPPIFHQICVNRIYDSYVALRQGYLDWIKHRKLFVLGITSRIVHSRPPFRFTRGQAAITALSFLLVLNCTIYCVVTPFLGSLDQELLCAQ